MVRLIRDFDWSTTSLGSMAHWSVSLRDTVAKLLDSALPTLLVWGPDFIQIYNDAYREVLGDRHPAALGQRTQDCWPDEREFTESIYRQIHKTGIEMRIEAPANFSVSGARQAAHYFATFSPIYDESNKINGIRAEMAGSGNFFATTRFAAEQLQQMFERAPGFMVLLKGPDHIIELANAAARQLIANREIIGKPARMAVPELAEQDFLALLDEAYVSGEAIVRRDMPVSFSSHAVPRYLNFIYQPIRDTQGKVTGIFVEGSDVTEKKQTGDALAHAHQHIIQRLVIEEDLFLDKARAEVILNSISDAVIGVDMAGNINYLNVAAENMTGWSRDEARGIRIAKVMNVVNSSTRKACIHPVEWVIQNNKPIAMSTGLVLIRRDGTEAIIEHSVAPVSDSIGEISGAVIMFHDISAVQMMAMKMAHLAQHDFLTNLPNRLLLNDRITQAISQAERRGTHLALLFLDLDNFKHINDSLGHAIGDKLLQSVARRLSACVRSSDTVSRQGGDEFVVLLTEDSDKEGAAVIADKILDMLSMSHFIVGHDLHVTPSIGISIFPADGQNAETLIKNADTAMYQAKEKGRNNYQFFKSDMNVRAVQRQVIETSLRHALIREQLVLHYQSKVNLATGKITGAEALLRWVHPQWGVMLPNRFVPVAEDSGLIVPIGRWVLREACLQAQSWKNSGLELGSIAVNISALEFRCKDFVDGVRAILAETGLSPDSLQLEITESVLMRDAESSTQVLQQLKKMGVQIAVDDFGTGYSSLSYLNQFPIDVLKIDRSFVQDILTAKGNGIIVSAVIAMGTSLKQQVVAEGVEQQVQVDFLKGQHCEEGQGFFFSQPLCAKHFAMLLGSCH
ncbi:MAG: EAL domain-containing protein [Burkholderiales bacterium]